MAYMYSTDCPTLSYNLCIGWACGLQSMRQHACGRWLPVGNRPAPSELWAQHQNTSPTPAATAAWAGAPSTCWAHHPPPQQQQQQHHHHHQQHQQEQQEEPRLLLLLLSLQELKLLLTAAARFTTAAQRSRAVGCPPQLGAGPGFGFGWCGSCGGGTVTFIEELPLT